MCIPSISTQERSDPTQDFVETTRDRNDPRPKRPGWGGSMDRQETPVNKSTVTHDPCVISDRPHSNTDLSDLGMPGCSHI